MSNKRTASQSLSFREIKKLPCMFECGSQNRAGALTAAEAADGDGGTMNLHKPRGNAERGALDTCPKRRAERHGHTAHRKRQ